MSDPRDEAVARLALARGFVDAARLEEARREQALLRQAGLPAGLLEALGATLTPAQLAELRGGAAAPPEGTLAGPAPVQAHHAGPAGPAPWGKLPGREVVRPGAAVGPYVIEQELGRGGMGVVYRARHAQLGRRVALKLCTGTGERHVRRFVREAQAMASLRHPNIVSIHEAGDAGRLPWLAMELVEGAESLEQRLERDGPLAPEEAAGVAAAVCRGLEHAHQQGVLHRDLKPSNLLMRAGGVPLLCDFGLAKVVAGAESLTRTGELLGTPGYMAPEQAAGREVDARSDVWGLGATLYALLTAQAPFKDDSLLSTLARVMTARYPPLREVRPDLPPALDAIVRRCLERRPGDRYPTAGLLAEDLERFLRGEGSDALARARARRLRRGVGAALALALGLTGVELVRRASPGPRPGATSPAPVPTTHGAGAPPTTEARPDPGAERPPLPPRKLPLGPERLRAFQALQAWLAVHPAGASRADALQALRALRREPLETLRSEGPCRPGATVHAAPLDAERLLVCGSLTPEVELLGLEGGAGPRAWSAAGPAGVHALAVAPSGATFVFGDDRGALHEVELGSGSVRRLWAPEPGAVSFGALVRCAAFAPDGTTVAVGGDWPEVRLLTRDGAALRRFGPHGDSVLGLTFTPDGARLVTITGRLVLDAQTERDDNALRVFDVASGALLRELPCPRRPFSLALSPDGRAALVGTRQGSLHVFDLETGREAPSPRAPDLQQETFSHPRAHSGIVVGVAFAPGDPRRAYSVSSDGDHDQRELRVWTASTEGLVLLRTERPTAPIDSLAVTPDGSCLVLAGTEGVAVWGGGDE